ncbi:hypothetical protein J2847_004194 [Azospirillum agricola]|uniref:hypothetical protein n=1 Tax=Azospirillum agricola TaxID=1720247 RepID=UPI001AEAD387|nr:hypothetical protein [Azospirillum agricola]MBP2230885.1 hypothetical protein [Azospirillum agricola]
MTDLLHDPFVQSSLLPLLLGVAAVGLLRLAGGQSGRSLAPAGIALAFLLIFALVVGVPAFPPPSSMGKLFWSAAGGLVLGASLDLAGVKGRAASLAVAGWLALALGWIAGPALDSVAAALPLAVLLAVGAWVAFADSAASEDRPAASAAVLLALSLSVGVTALIGSSASLAQLGLALTAATGGFLLWNWPTERHLWGASGRIALGLPVLLAAILALYTQVQAATLLLALPALAAGPLRRRLPIPDTGFGPALGTVAVTVLAVLPALVAIGASWLLTGGEASPY